MGDIINLDKSYESQGYSPEWNSIRIKRDKHDDMIDALRYAFMARENKKQLHKSKIKNIIAGLRPAFSNCADKLLIFFDCAADIAFGPNPDEDPEGARAYNRRVFKWLAIIIYPLTIAVTVMIALSLIEMLGR